MVDSFHDKQRNKAARVKKFYENYQDPSRMPGTYLPLSKEELEAVVASNAAQPVRIRGTANGVPFDTGEQPQRIVQVFTYADRGVYIATETDIFQIVDNVPVLVISNEDLQNAKVLK